MYDQTQTSSAPAEDAGHPQSCGFHHLSALFPLMDDSALTDLAEDIRRNGLQEPILRHEGLILDGRNRYRACERAGVKPRFCEFEGSDPIAHVVSANLHRRHLNETQRAMVAAKLATLRDGQRQVGQLAQVPTQSEAAALLNVSPRSVKRPAVVRGHGAPELVSAVERGDIPVSRAAKLARKPIEQQSAEAKSPTVPQLTSRRNPAHERPSELSSLSWAKATPEMQARFVNTVGLEHIWRAADRELQKTFIAAHRREWELANTDQGEV
jgi:ParB-like chromosome segregation protein Spo0J